VRPESDLKLQFNMQAITEYQVKKKRFLKDLIILFNFSGGQPGRATELISIIYKNSNIGTL
jgi:hypothetical protein